MHRITVRDCKDEIILVRDVDEPPNNILFDELAREIQQDCYIDVCRLDHDEDDYRDDSLPHHTIGFEDAVEFELIHGDNIPEDDDELYFQELDRLDPDETEE